MHSEISTFSRDNIFWWINLLGGCGKCQLRDCLACFCRVYWHFWLIFWTWTNPVNYPFRPVYELLSLHGKRSDPRWTISSGQTANALSCWLRCRFQLIIKSFWSFMSNAEKLFCSPFIYVQMNLNYIVVIMIVIWMVRDPNACLLLFRVVLSI